MAKADRSPLKRRRRAQDLSAEGPKNAEVPKAVKWGPHRYGATNVPPEHWDGRPRALLLFSGKSRDGDISSFLNEAGWIVVAVDVIGPVTCDVLNPDVYGRILKDVQDGVYDAVGIATPCETLSPLREKAPGPKPLRSLEHPEGFGRKKLNAAELAQVSQANQMFDLSRDAFRYQLKDHRTVWLENPDHGDKLDFWKTKWGSAVERHALVDKAKFDQCMFDAEVTKPTKIASFGMDLSVLKGVRCGHAPRTWTKPDGSEYVAKHESLVQRWRTNDQGIQERASKALGAYPPKLCGIIAGAMVGTDLPRPNRLRKMQTEEIP